MVMQLDEAVAKAISPVSVAVTTRFGTVVSRMKDNPRAAQSTRVSIYKYFTPTPKKPKKVKRTITEFSPIELEWINCKSDTWKRLPADKQIHFASFLARNE